MPHEADLVDPGVLVAARPVIRVAPAHGLLVQSADLTPQLLAILDPTPAVARPQPHLRGPRLLLEKAPVPALVPPIAWPPEWGDALSRTMLR